MDRETEQGNNVLGQDGGGGVSPSPSTPRLTPTVSTAVVDGLVHLGVRRAFGLVGGAVAPFSEALDASDIDVVHCRHEAGAAFAALEHSLHTGEPAVVFVTTGPGITNAITGLTAARADGAKVILVSATTAAAQRGRGAFQETSPYTSPYTGLYEPGSLFHEAVELQDAEEIPLVLMRFAQGLSRPSGFVGHIGLPIRAQKVPFTGEVGRPPLRTTVSTVPQEALDAVAGMLDSRLVMWVGFGARGAAPAVRMLAERLGCAVMSTPRGKGVFPEDHPQYLGVTGFGGHDQVRAHLNAHRPDHVLVLGSRLGEFSSGWDDSYQPRRSFIHVDVQPEVAGRAYPTVPVMAVASEIRVFAIEMLRRLGPDRAVKTLELPGPPRFVQEPPRAGRVRSSFLLRSLQRLVVDGLELPVLTEAGNAFAWGNHALLFREPRYRVSMAFGSMGHATSGVLGLAMARRGRAVALVGDGAMLMNNELSTAVQYGVPATWVVLNDAVYGMVDQGMRAQGLRPVQTHMPATDFAEVARATGARAWRVDNEGDLDDALSAAMEGTGPSVVDVVVDPTEPAPFLWRVKNLLKQTNDQGPRGQP